MRWKVTLEYHGGGYAGWQRQEDAPSIQQAVEQAIAGFSGEAAHVTGAGRTDAGVHALGQVAHFDLQKDWPADVVRDALNAHLRPAPIAVLSAEPAATDFDARFHARRRHYLYRILNRRPPVAGDGGRVWQVSRNLDAAAMHEAAQCLIGRHDFTTFRAAACQAKSPVKTIESITVTRAGDEIRLAVTAPSFLHHQVRNITGTLKLVGLGKWRPDQMTLALAACDRKAGGQTAPACGLYFVAVEY